MPPPFLNRALALFQPDTTEPPPAVRFIPASFLFAHAEPLPEGMTPGEIAGFVEVAMEGLAPMPLEQLAWGYLGDEKATYVLLFAAATERLVHLGLTLEESFYHVLPSFYAAAPADGAARWVFLWEDKNLTAIRYEAGIPVPARLEIESLADDSPAAAFAARENLLKRLGSTARNEAAPGLLTRPEARRLARDRLDFWFAHYASPEAEPTQQIGFPPPNPATRWTADLRGSLFRVTEQQRRRSLRIANRVLLAAGAVALVLFVLQLAWAGGYIWYKVDERNRQQHEQLVNQIEDNNALLIKIQQFSENTLRPFEMLGSINSMRPRGVVFKSVKASNSNELSAECIAPDPKQMNDFLDAIKDSRLATVGPANEDSDPRGVHFQLDLKFKSIPVPEALPPEPTEAPPVAENQNPNDERLRLNGEPPEPPVNTEPPPENPDSQGQPNNPNIVVEQN